MQTRRPGILIPAAMVVVMLALAGCGGAPSGTKEGGSASDTRATVAEAPVPAGPPGAALGMDSSFWQTWGDGQAELTSYRLQFPRYGAARPGTAVAIFVTENFSRKSRVKTDATPEASPDAFPVMKLNLVEDFQTGIYDYNVMTSTFVALRPVEGRAEGYPTKVSFGSQEWCGHVYQQLLFGQHAVSSSMHSYFEGEADLRAELPSPRNGVVEDALLHWARGMAQPMLKPGETRSVPFLPSLKSARLQHRPLGWVEARLTRRDGTQTITVPAGNFEVEVYEAEIQGGATRSYFVEKSMPRRVVKWQSSDGEAAEMVKSIRARYWQMNDLPSEARLADLGLAPPRIP